MPLHFMDGGGRMGQAIRDFDWATTPLGPPADWPPTLKVAVSLVLGSHFPKCIAWGTHLISIYNDAFLPILGDKPEALGRPFSEVWSEVWDSVGPIADAAFRGEATFIEDYRLIVKRSDAPEEAWFTFCYSPIRDEFGHVCGMMDTVVETTGKVLAERRTKLLNDELAHRMKNMLAIVQSIASQTFDKVEDVDAARSAFGQRLAALGAAHDMLTRASWNGAWMEEVVRSALAPLYTDMDRVNIEGPPIYLGGKRVMALALAVHELATNAAKHGAMSTGNGVVSIGWQAGTPGSDDEFRFWWTERGGPPCRPPTRQGFGSKLIKRVFPADFRGSIEIDYPPEGLRLVLSTQMHRLDDIDP